jgi:TRAP-type mannitol/chloroaromatic compound transport system permease small subunit
MMFFNYLFYRLKWWNEKVVIDFLPYISPVVIMSVFQGFNVIFLFDLIKFYWGIDLLFFEKAFLFPPILLIAINYFVYKSENKQTIIKRQVSELSRKTQMTYDVMIILYFILTLVLLIWIGYEIRQLNI